VLVAALREAAARWRLATGVAAALGLYLPSLWWVTEFSVPGYGALVVIEVAIVAVAVLLVPPGRGRMLAFPAALVLAEAARGRWPFGGLPLAGIDLGQVGGPLAPAARLGGHLLLVALVGLGGVALAALYECLPRRQPPEDRPSGSIRRRRLLLPALGAAALVLASALAGAAAGGGTPGPVLRVASVQGGGPRGLRAIDVDPSVVFEAQLEASGAIRPPVDLVVWPEDVVRVDGTLEGSPEDVAMSALARRLQATVVAGVVEDLVDRPSRFRNAAVAWGPDGTRVARYDKVHRVPFGEYVPLRSLIDRLANLSAVPRDAIAGRGPGVLRTPVAPLGVLVSYEVFFAGRARAAVQAGGQVVLVPTNASSYRTSQVPAQELAAARLRALETGRPVVQSAPTGYSALVDAGGKVLSKTRLGRPAVLQGAVRLRSGQTLATRLGDGAAVLMALMALAGGWTSRKLELSRRRFVAV
jgi:apolipoprotein N-acyltransferase